LGVRNERGLRARIEFNPRWCKACGICIAFCPASVFDTDQDGRPIVARPEACTGCQLCELRCPDFAIAVEVEREGE